VRRERRGREVPDRVGRHGVKQHEHGERQRDERLGSGGLQRVALQPHGRERRQRREAVDP
jgi:hypothetical protein